MTGLENILLQIENDAKTQAEKIIEQAEHAAQKCVDEAILAAEEISNDYNAAALKTAEEIKSRAKAGDEAKLSRAKLLKKQEIIKAAIDNAKKAIKEQSEAEYFVFLESLLKKYALNESGKMLLSETDKAAMTPEFEKAVKASALEALAAEIPARGGFILVYGSIEINCTIDAVFDAATEEISDMLNEFLFVCEGGI